MFVDVVAVVSAPRPAVLVPLTAVRRSPYGEHVFRLVVEGGKLRDGLLVRTEIPPVASAAPSVN
jgi:hypothetical protein